MSVSIGGTLDINIEPADGSGLFYSCPYRTWKGAKFNTPDYHMEVPMVIGTN